MTVLPPASTAESAPLALASARFPSRTFASADECQNILHRWLLNYCQDGDSLSGEMRARYPLRQASVEVKELPGKPGAFSCNIFLQPHFQIDDIAAGVRLITELAPARA
jgi:type VI secretion system protein ImpD